MKNNDVYEFEARGRTFTVSGSRLHEAMREAKELAYTYCINGVYGRKICIIIDDDGNCYIEDLGPNEIVHYHDNVIRIYEIETFVLDEDNEYVTCAEELELYPVDDDEVYYSDRPYTSIPKWLD